MYTFNNNAATWRNEEKEALLKRVNVLEKALASTITENRMFAQLFYAYKTKMDNLTATMKQFQERHGTGEADPNLVVRQQDKPMNRKDYKDLVLEEKDVVKVNIIVLLFYYHFFTLINT